MQLSFSDSNFPKMLIVGRLYNFTAWSSTEHCFMAINTAVCIESCDVTKQMELFNNISDDQDTRKEYLDVNQQTCDTFVGFLIREKCLLPIDIEEVSFAGIAVKGPVGLERIAIEYAKYKTEYEAKQVSKKEKMLKVADGEAADRDYFNSWTVVKPNEDSSQVVVMQTDAQAPIATTLKEGQVCTFVSWVFETENYDPFKTCVALKDLDINKLRAEWEAPVLNAVALREMHWETCVAFTDYLIEAGYLKEIPVTEMLVYHQVTELIPTIKG